MNRCHEIPEEELWKCWKEEADTSAKENLIRKYLPLVEYVAQRLMIALPQKVSKEDLVSLGHFGLLEAVNKFDHKRGLKFSTFGMWRIRGAMIDGLREDDWAPRSLREKAKKIEEAFQTLEQKFGRPPSEKEVSEYMEMPEKDLLKIISDVSVASLLSLDEPITDEEDQVQTRMAHIVDNSLDHPDRHMDQEANREILADAIKRLPEKEKLVVSLFYYEELTLTEIAEVMELSPSRISQLHSKAIFRLRNVLGRYKQLMMDAQ